MSDMDDDDFEDDDDALVDYTARLEEAFKRFEEPDITPFPRTKRDPWGRGWVDVHLSIGQIDRLAVVIESTGRHEHDLITEAIETFLTAHGA